MAILIGSIGTIKNYSYDECWVIVRSLKNPINGTQHHPELSPSIPLFYGYLSWRKQGKWNKTTFETQYAPRFLEQLSQDKEARNSLNKLFVESKTKNILLVCFCPDEQLCHRSIIAGILYNVGVNVVGG